MKKIISFILAYTLILLHSYTLVHAEEVCSNPNKQSECDQLINDLTNKISRAQSSARTLAEQIANFDNQISLSTLKIQQTEQQISSITGKISQLETTLQSKVTLLQRQISHTYKQGAGDSLRMLLSSANFTQMLQQFKYSQIIQSDNRRYLHDAQLVQSNFAKQKALVEASKKNLQIQKNNLASARAAKDNLLKQTKNDEANYQKLLSQAIAEREAINSFVNQQGGASLLSNQTVCNDWGCYYNQRDAEWGGLLLGRSSDTVARYGCLVTSVSMVASHNKYSIKPNDIARTADAFYSNTGYLYYSITVNNLNIDRSYTANIDSQLAAGNPVIVGVYKGPAHFVVLKSGSNGNYVMNDPYLPNGHDVNFKDHYPVSSITYAGTVSFRPL